MKVTESETHKCDIQLDDISEDEHQAMFLEGLRVLVKEARDGHIGDYIVLPYKDVPEGLLSPSTSTLEISDEDVDALIQIGAVSMIMKGIETIED